VFINNGFAPSSKKVISSILCVYQKRLHTMQQESYFFASLCISKTASHRATRTLFLRFFVFIKNGFTPSNKNFISSLLCVYQKRLCTKQQESYFFDSLCSIRL
jgi:hypothetical protein